ncbi:MAG TPA: TlpA disulfide reductase family protein [Actinomycetota bacterium]|jgi:thiol-disulfide isomerase/thioredoxin
MRRGLALLLLLAACAGPTEPDARPSPEGALLPEDRLELPAYDLAQYRAMIQELEGTPVVVNIWGSWCPPCRVEAPDLADVSAAYEGRVQFVGIDILDERQAARDFILEFDWQYPHIFDPTGAIRDGLGYIGQPVTIVHDAQGAVTFEWTGAVAEAQLTEEIEKVL